jgi:site-specific recombinase XerD
MNDHDIHIQGPPVEAARPRLLDLARETIRRRHYSYRTEQAYLHWMKRFILFSGKRHPRELGAADVTAFLNHLVLERRVAAATQNQALAALLFLYKEVLAETLPWLEGLEHAKRPARRPTVLTVSEVRHLLAQLGGTKWLMASLLYGAGLRLRECLKLRDRRLFAAQLSFRFSLASWRLGGSSCFLLSVFLRVPRFSFASFAFRRFTS